MNEHATRAAPGVKELGFWMCTALVVGNTIGIGIFLLPASLAPYGFNAMIGWGITVLGMSVLARVFARLARGFPEADGPYAYIQATLGDQAAFVAIWCYWVSCWITNAAIAIGVVGYFMVKVKMPMAPLVLGVVLGDLMEQNFRRGLSITNGDPVIFFSSTICITLWILAVAVVTVSGSMTNSALACAINRSTAFSRERLSGWARSEGPRRMTVRFDSKSN